MQLPASGPVDGHLHHGQPLDRPGQHIPQLGDVGDQRVPDPVPGAQRRQIGPVRGGEHPLERRSVRRLPVLQGGEDGAAVVVGDDHLQVRALLRRPDQQPADVVQERQVPDQGAHRATHAQSHADRGGQGAVNTGQASVGHHARRFGPVGHQVQVPDRVARGDDEHVVRRRAGRDLGRQLRSGDHIAAGLTGHPGDRCERPTAPPLPPLQPVTTAPGLTGEEPRRHLGDDPVRPTAGLRGGRTPVDDGDRVDVAPGEQPLDRPAQRRSAEHDHPVHPLCPGAEQQPVGGDRVRSTARTGAGLGQQRPPVVLGDVSGHRSGAVAGHHDRGHVDVPAARRRLLGRLRQRRGLSELGYLSGRPRRSVRDQRFAVGEVQVHGPWVTGVGALRGHHGLEDGAAQSVQLAVPAGWCGQVQGHPGGVVEQADLVGGLVGADAAQLVRAVRGEHHQRHPAVVCLEHRGVQVRHGTAGRRRHGDRSARGPGDAEGEVPGAALVDAHVHGQLRGVRVPVGALPGRLGQGVGQRCAARTRAEDHVPDSGGRQHLDEHARGSDRRVHVCPFAALTRCSHRCTRSEGGL